MGGWSRYRWPPSVNTLSEWGSLGKERQEAELQQHQSRHGKNLISGDICTSTRADMEKNLISGSEKFVHKYLDQLLDVLLDLLTGVNDLILTSLFVLQN